MADVLLLCEPLFIAGTLYLQVSILIFVVDSDSQDFVI